MIKNKQNLKRSIDESSAGFWPAAGGVLTTTLSSNNNNISTTMPNSKPVLKLVAPKPVRARVAPLSFCNTKLFQASPIKNESEQKNDYMADARRYSSI